MDMLLRAVDQVKQHMEEIENGSDSLTTPDPALVESLTAIGEGRPLRDDEVIAEPADSAYDNTGDPDGDSRVRKLELDGAKADLLDHFVADLDEQLNKLGEQIELLSDADARPGIPQDLEEIGSDLHATIDFFEVDAMGTLANAIIEAAMTVAQTEGVAFDQVLPRLRALLGIVVTLKDGLGAGRVDRPRARESRRAPAGGARDRVGR